MSNNENFRMLFFIANPKQNTKAQEFLTENNIPISYSVFAKGTASDEMLDMLGLGGTDKTVIVTMLPKTAADELLGKLYKELKLHKPASGIAFTIPLSGSNAAFMKLMQTVGEKEDLPESEEDKMGSEYTMIMAFVDQGFSEDVMSAAKPVGARGGTVFHSRSAGNEDAAKIMGIAVQPEREIVMILAKNADKLPIMKAINEKCGINSEAHGMIISVPVDSVAGLDVPYDA